MGSRSYLCRWQVERKVILNVMWVLELNLLIPKQTFTFPSCSPVSPPAPPSPVGSPPACSLPPTVSRTPPSLSASWPSTPVTMASSWSSTPQTLQLQQSRYFVCSSLTPPFHFSCPGSSCVLVIRILGTNPPLDLCGRVPTWSGVARVGELVDQHHLHPAHRPHRPHRPPSPAPLLWKAAMFFLSQVSFSKVQRQRSSTKLLSGRQRSQQRRRSGVQEERLSHLHHLHHLRHHLLRPTHRALASTASRQD